MNRLFYISVFVIGLKLSGTHTWDIAVSHDNGIALETLSGELLMNTALQTKPGALFYDPLEQKLFLGNNLGESSILYIDLSGPADSQRTAISQSVLLRRPGDASVQGIAYDPVERSIYWTDGATGRRIIKYDLPALNTPDQQYEAGKRQVLINFEEEMPQGIAVDACRRKLYWTNANHHSPSIEQSNLDGTERKVLINTDLFIPLDIVIHQGEKRIYWADDKEGVYFRIESADLDGNDRKVIYEGKDHQPSGLAISGNGKIYWTDWVYKALWSLDNSQTKDVAKPIILQKFRSDPFSVVTRLNVAQAYGDSEECSAIIETLQNRSEPVPFLELQCLHGVLIGANCHCANGYTGTHCELPICYNYCLGEAQCQIENNKPVCICQSEREGPRCEITKKRSALIMVAGGPESERVQKSWLQTNESDELDELKEAACKASVNECLPKTPISVLAALCGLLFLTTCILTWRLYHSTRRPRIHKRIIVNKNQPMSTRSSPSDGSNCLAASTQQAVVSPETCEITIENCCNMNICETFYPCFDPVSYREPTEKYRSKKEEKKNLLVGIENGDDLY